MTAERKADHTATRTRWLVQITKSKMPKKATLALQQRPRRENAAQRVRHFLRIDRGEEA